MDLTRAYLPCQYEFHVGPLLYHLKDVMCYTARAEKETNFWC